VSYTFHRDIGPPDSTLPTHQAPSLRPVACTTGAPPEDATPGGPAHLVFDLQFFLFLDHMGCSVSFLFENI
jgi:hypothetical protein